MYARSHKFISTLWTSFTGSSSFVNETNGIYLKCRSLQVPLSSIPTIGFDYKQRTFSSSTQAISIVNESVEDSEVSNKDPTQSIFESTSEEDLDLITPNVLPSFNFAAYVNKSQTLQELTKLGVDLHKLEKRKGIPQFILGLDFNRDISSILRLLHDVGVPVDQLGYFVTKNPLIFKETLEDLQVRINYLHSKRFSTEMVARIVTLNPHWLMFSTQRIDRRLGFFQDTFSLNGNEVRTLTTKLPRIITYNTAHLKLVTFSFKESMGFDKDEIKSLLLKRPRLWMMNEINLLARFNFVHNKMKIPHDQISKQPQVLGSREFRTNQRHLFLVHLGRAQYDPKMPGYVSLERLVAGTDAEFSLEVAKSPVQKFNLFLKTL